MTEGAKQLNESELSQVAGGDISVLDPVFEPSESVSDSDIGKSPLSSTLNNVDPADPVDQI